MSDKPCRLNRRSLLASAAILGGNFLPVTTGAAQQNGKILEIVSTEEAELYYEFVVRGEVTGTQTSDKISAPGGNDAIIGGNDPSTTIVRGYTGNPGYGDAYRIDGDLVFFEQTAGTSDFDLRIDGEPLSVDDYPEKLDPTTPDPLTYIERNIQGTFAIKTLEQGELYYEFVVDGEVEGTSISEQIETDLDGNDAAATSLNSGYTVVRGFTGNPGYGDAYTINGELIAFRKDGGSSDFTLVLNGSEFSLEELANTGTGYPTNPSTEQPVTVYENAMDELERLGENIGSPNERNWYNQIQGQMRRAERAMGTLVDEGYSFRLDAGDELSIEVYTPETSNRENSDSQLVRDLDFEPRSRQTEARRLGARTPFLTTITVSSIVLAKYALLPTLATVGVIKTAPYAASALTYLGGQIPTATRAISQLYSSQPSLFLLNTSPLTDPRIRKELGCLISSNAASKLVENADLRATAQVIADTTGGCSVTPLDLADYAADKLLNTSQDSPTIEVVTSVIAGGIQNEWHVESQEHDHSHNYQDERYSFSLSEDGRVYMWLELQNVPSTQYKFEWYRPSGDSGTFSDEVPPPNDGDVWSTRKIWSYLDIGPSTETGEWRVEFIIDGELTSEESFRIRP